MGGRYKSVEEEIFSSLIANHVLYEIEVEDVVVVDGVHLKLHNGILSVV